MTAPSISSASSAGFGKCASDDLPNANENAHVPSSESGAGTCRTTSPASRIETFAGALPGKLARMRSLPRCQSCVHFPPSTAGASSGGDGSELRRDRRHSRMRASKLIAVSFDQLHLRIVRVQRMPVRASGDPERIVVEIDPFVEHRADDRDVEPLRMKLLHAVEVHEQGERADLGLARL